MSVSNCQVRRATVDDLVGLRRLWQQAQLPVAALEKKLTEFQVAETADGDLLGAIALTTAQQQGAIHAEVFKNPELAAELRPRLWDRIQSLARNHGLSRLWIANASSLFWLDQGFEPAPDQLIQQRAGAFGETSAAGPWLTLRLREDSAAARSVDAELELFRLAQRDERERRARQIRVLRAVAGVVVVLVLVLIGFAAVYVLQRSRTGQAP